MHYRFFSAIHAHNGTFRFCSSLAMRWIALSATARSCSDFDRLNTPVAKSYMRRSELLSVPRMFQRLKGRTSLFMGAYFLMSSDRTRGIIPEPAVRAFPADFLVDRQQGFVPKFPCDGREHRRRPRSRVSLCRG